MTNTTRIIFVRHARSQYGEDDRIRPLTDDGFAAMFGAEKPARIYYNLV